MKLVVVLVVWEVIHPSHNTTGTRYLSSLKPVRRLVIVRVSYLLRGYYDLA